MSNDPTHHDLDVVVHALLALGVVASDAYILLFLVPDLFDRHRSEWDMVALAVVGGTLAFSYLASRYLWRSIHAIFHGEDR